MLFNTLQYAIFFIVVFTVHWLLPQRLRRPFLLISSYYFYASAVPQYVFLILGLTLFNYLVGLIIDSVQHHGARRALLILAVIGNLGSLAYFKYTYLIIHSVHGVLGGIPTLAPLFTDALSLNIILPLGISFFTFEFIHYVAEVYKGLRPMRNPIDFGLFAAFFPTQIAGPIKRFPDFRKQLEHPQRLREVNIDYGINLLLRGLVKKSLVADLLVPTITTAFANPSTLGPGAAWFSVIAFATQIYCDFSGYTDMGRGSAVLLGYAVPENFASPYQSPDPSVFWRNWHISLSSWLRDYLFIPLGGSRVVSWRIYVNLMITMALGGLWHGASWHFMVWGVYQGVLLCVYRLWSKTIGKIPTYQAFAAIPIIDFFKRPVTFIYVCIGWVFFRAATVHDAFAMFRSMIAIHRPLSAGLHPSLTALILVGLASLVVVSGWVWWSVKEPVTRLWQAGAGRWASPALLTRVNVIAWQPIFLIIGLLLFMLWPPHDVEKFIYFQF